MDKRIRLLIPIACVAFGLCGCASVANQEPVMSESSTVIQAKRSGKNVYKVTRINGKNVIEVLSGEPDEMAIAAARIFIDNNTQLTEGEQTVVELEQYRAK